MATKTSNGGDIVLKAYFNAKAAIWDETIAEKDTGKLTDMAGRLAIEPGFTVLDVGTGTGVFAPFILEKIGPKGRLVCLDIAEEMLKKLKAKRFPGNIEYLCADIADTRLSEGTFDAVICYSSFPHFRDKLKSLREARRVLKNGGLLFICHTSSRTAINDIHRQIPEVCNDLIPEDEEMYRLLSAAGFKDINIADNSSSYLASAVKPE